MLPNLASRSPSKNVRCGYLLIENKLPIPVKYIAQDGLAVYEGDIVLGTMQEMDQVVAAVESEKAQLENDIQRKHQIIRSIIGTGLDHGRRWPDNTVYYEIPSGFSKPERITDAIQKFMEQTNINFVEKTPDIQNWILFEKSDADCWSYVGFKGGQQIIKLSDGCGVWQIVHELMHALGFWHEQSRSDRDNYVTILWANIDPDKTSNFDKHATDGLDIGSYDYNSIMHYGSHAFSKNTLPTIEPKQHREIGQRSHFSKGDLAALRSTYSELIAEYSGGHGGHAFEDPPIPPNSRIKAIRIRHAARIDGLGLVYRGPNGVEIDGPFHGGDGGYLARFDLDDDEYLVSINGTYADEIDSIQFVTNKKTSITYGGTGGDVRYQYDVPTLIEFSGFSGRCGSRLDGIGMQFRNSTLPHPGQAVAFTGPSGGRGGRLFCDELPDTYKIIGVRIFAQNVIDGIGLTVRRNDGVIIDYPIRGGKGGAEYVFSLTEDEFIIGASGRFGQVIDSLTLYTNLRASPTYGGNDGESTFDYQFADRQQLAGIFGKEGNYVDALGFIFRSI